MSGRLPVHTEPREVNLGARPRELWFWLGAARLTAGGVLAAPAIAFYAKETRRSQTVGI